LLVYLFVSTFSYYPYNISYFNEIVWDQDASLQISRRLEHRLGAGTEGAVGVSFPITRRAVYQPGKPRSGRIIVSVNDLVGINIDPGTIRLAEGIISSLLIQLPILILVYDISPAELEVRCARRQTIAESE
jgi:hypothetical protein